MAKPIEATRFTLRNIPRGLWRELRKVALDMDMTATRAVVWALEEFVRNHGKPAR